MTTTPFEIEFDGAVIRGESAGFGLPVVFLHAGVCDRRMWEGQMQALAGEGYHVVAYDRRGFGETESADVPFNHVVDLEAVLDRLGLNAAVLVGNSLGGGIAIDFALEHPQRVVGLVLIGSAVTGFEATEPTEDILALEDTLEYALSRGNIESANRIEAHMWLDGPLQEAGRVDGPVRDLFLEMNAARRHQPELTQQEVPDAAVDHLHSITAPALLVVGALDYPDVLEAHELLAEELEQSFAVMLDDTAHLPSLERPEEFDPLLLEFLEAVSGAGDEN
ncbi:MAG TPA: alpha/beta hydrolase [Devosia sp.]